MDTEDLPIQGASVALAEASLEAVSGKDGRFMLTNIEPGAYNLLVARIGYDTAAKQVTVEAGKVTPIALTMTPIVIIESFHETIPFSGILECSFATAVWVSSCDYPYTAVYYTALGQGVNLSNYGAPAEPMENVWRFNTAGANATSGIVSELVWEATSDASKVMMMQISCTEYDPVLDDCSGWSAANNPPQGESPIRHDWKIPKGEDVLMTRIYLPWGDAQVALSQKYDVYHTFFWGEDPPEDYRYYDPDATG